MKSLIENRRKWLRGITDPDDWVDVLCDLALDGLRYRFWRAEGVEYIWDARVRDFKGDELDYITDTKMRSGPTRDDGSAAPWTE